MAALGVVVVREIRLTLFAGGARLDAARLGQALIRELDSRAARPLAQDVGGGLPEGARLFGAPRFG